MEGDILLYILFWYMIFSMSFNFAQGRLKKKLINAGKKINLGMQKFNCSNCQT